MVLKRFLFYRSFQVFFKFKLTNEIKKKTTQKHKRRKQKRNCSLPQVASYLWQDNWRARNSTALVIYIQVFLPSSSPFFFFLSSSSHCRTKSQKKLLREKKVFNAIETKSNCVRDRESFKEIFLNRFFSFSLFFFDPNLANPMQFVLILSMRSICMLSTKQTDQIQTNAKPIGQNKTKQRL